MEHWIDKVIKTTNDEGESMPRNLEEELDSARTEMQTAFLQNRDTETIAIEDST